MTQSLSSSQARRMALAAQKLGGRREGATAAGLTKLAAHLGVVQIDSVNVVSRTHYLPFFARLGNYDRTALETIAWGKSPTVFEYWAHEASLIPITCQPLFRWRMDDARDGVGVWKGVARFLKEQHPFVDQVRSIFASEGQMTASEIPHGKKGEGGWWGWSEAKRACECLFWTGELTTVTRRGNFERVYGLTEQVLPSSVVAAPSPTRAEAHRSLLGQAIRAMGVATERDLRDYFRLGVADTKKALAELVETGAIEPVTVEGWRDPAWIDPAARLPRTMEAASLLSPFDNAIWFRERTERIWGVRVRLEIYTPAPKRVHGYYVLPFLEGDRITARVDLKADRAAGLLRVQAAHREEDAGPDTADRLADELALMAHWLGLGGVAVEPKGDFAAALSAVIGR